MTLADENVAWLLERYPGWSPIFSELKADGLGVVIVIGFELSRDRVLSIDEVGKFLSGGG